jgi:uncharacterized protein YihD (DUF1040 family)
MNLVERYALSCGVKIGKPFMVAHSYPTKSSKYITIHNGQKFNSRNYNYWSEVVSMLKPILKPKGYSIIQIGGKEDQKISGVDECYCGDINFRQTAGIIKAADLHLGIDSFPVHAASCFGVKIVALYSNMYASQSKPYWSKDDDVKLIQGDLRGSKPSYSNNESDKVINRIKPEEISNSVLDLLEIDQKISEKTIFIGEEYGPTIVEYVPDFPISRSNFPEGNVNVRLDLFYNKFFFEDVLRSRKCSVIVDDIFDYDLIYKYKDNVTNIYIDLSDISKDFDLDYLKGTGVSLYPFVYNDCLSSDEINQIRLKYYDYEIFEHNKIPKEGDRPKFDKGKKLKYKSCKYILSKNKVFNSELNWRKGIESINLGDCVGDFVFVDEIWEEVDYFRVFED